MRPWIKTFSRDNRVLVVVKDNGIGIPAPILKRVFEPFFTTKESKKGVGLGLSLCREFLTHAGGSVSAESKPGKGSTFVVTLKTAQAGAGGGSGHDKGPHRRRRGAAHQGLQETTDRERYARSQRPPPAAEPLSLMGQENASTSLFSTSNCPTLMGLNSYSR